MCETLHEHFGQLCRIVAHYCGLDTDGAPTAAYSAGGDQAVGAATLLGSRQMRLEQWLVLMRDSKVCSPGFERHRVVTAFNASRGLKLHRCAGEGASS